MSLYTDFTRVYSRLPTIGSLSISSADQVIFVNDAEALVNAKIVRNYSVPVASSVPLIASIATDLTAYLVMSRRVFAREMPNDSPWPDRYKEAMDELESIANGDTLLVDSSGTLLAARTDVAEIDSTHRTYVPTFSDLPMEDNIQDQDKIDDKRDEKGLTVFRDILT